MDFAWLASYPKSGNTWVRFLFTNLIHGPFDHSQKIFEVTPVLERGVDPANLHEDRINLIKTHKQFAPDLPFMDRTVGIVYIVRNPFDVMMSNLNYYFLTNGSIAAGDTAHIQAIANRYVDAYLKNGGDPRWAQVNYGTWNTHIESWVKNAPGIPVRIVRYEDLLADTAATLQGVCDFLSLETTPENIARAVENSSFSSMRELEERELREKRPGMFYTGATKSDKGFRFMNRGKVGVGRESLSDEILARFRQTFMPMIEEFDYA